MADRFMQQHYSKGAPTPGSSSGGCIGAVGIPRKKPPQHRRLRKYASETSFGGYSSPGSSIGSGSGVALLPPGHAGRIRTMTLMAGQAACGQPGCPSAGHSREQLLDDDTPSPPMLVGAQGEARFTNINYISKYILQYSINSYHFAYFSKQ
jgi:hypothetical protein